MTNSAFPAEPHHFEIDWNEKDNERNLELYSIDFLDVAYGLTDLHVRVSDSDSNRFTALVKVGGMIFAIECLFEGHIQILSAQLAKQDERTTYQKALSEKPI